MVVLEDLDEVIRLLLPEFRVPLDLLDGRQEFGDSGLELGVPVPETRLGLEIGLPEKNKLSRLFYIRKLID